MTSSQPPQTSQGYFVISHIKTKHRFAECISHTEHRNSYRSLCVHMASEKTDWPLTPRFELPKPVASFSNKCDGVSAVCKLLESMWFVIASDMILCELECRQRTIGLPKIEQILHFRAPLGSQLFWHCIAATFSNRELCWPHMCFRLFNTPFMLVNTFSIFDTILVISSQVCS